MSITMTIEELTTLVATIQNNNSQPKRKYGKTITKELTNSITLDTFVENMTYRNVDNLISSDLIDHYYNTIIDNLKKYDQDNRPIICTDLKRRKFMWNNNGKFEEGTNFIDILYDKIERNAFKQLRKYNARYVDVDDEEENERLYANSEDYKKTAILMVLCDTKKYQHDKVKNKMLIKLADFLKN